MRWYYCYIFIESIGQYILHHYEDRYIQCNIHVMNTKETDRYYNIADKTCWSVLLQLLSGYVIAIIARSVTLPLLVVLDVGSETAVVVAEGVVMRSSMCVGFVETIDGSAREQS